MNILKWKKKEYLIFSGDSTVIDLIDLDQDKFDISKRIRIHNYDFKLMSSIRIIGDDFLIGQMSMANQYF